MTKYYCDHCGKEIKYFDAVKLKIRGLGARYRSFDTTILLHKGCVSKALGLHIYQDLLTKEAEYEERKRAREKERNVTNGKNQQL